MGCPWPRDNWKRDWMGELESAPIRFQPGLDVAQAGVLLALPALLATGLLRYTRQFYTLPRGFYGVESIFCCWH